MRDTLNNITIEELCHKIGVADVRTLASTDGFPNAFFDGNELLYKKEDVLKFFNIDNIDEPFITAVEAAQYVGISSNQLTDYAFYGKVPSYRLKSVKGSGYLFRKSELDFFKKIKIEGNTDFINKSVGIQLMKDMFGIYIDSIKDNLTKEQLYIVSSCVFDNLNLNKISKDSNVSISKIRQTFNVSVRRIKKIAKDFSSSDLLDLKKQILHKDIEISYLKSKLKKEGSLKEDVSNDALVTLVNSLLNIDLYYESLSVRTLNTLRQYEVFTIYNLLMNFNTYNGTINKLISFRNMGSKGYREIRDFIIEKQDSFESQTGINSKDFFTKKPQSEDDLILFNKIHEYISLYRERKK